MAEECRDAPAMPSRGTEGAHCISDLISCNNTSMPGAGSHKPRGQELVRGPTSTGEAVRRHGERLDSQGGEEGESVVLSLLDFDESSSRKPPSCSVYPAALYRYPLCWRHVCHTSVPVSSKHNRGERRLPSCTSRRPT